jgi:hypothetical protein
MGLFNKQSSAEDQHDSGTEYLRRVLYSWTFKAAALAAIARDTQVGIDALDSFAHGRASLAPDALDRIARHLCEACYCAATDKLTPLHKREPMPTPRVDPNLFDPRTEISDFFRDLRARKAREQAERWARNPPKVAPHDRRKPGWAS